MSFFSALFGRTQQRALSEADSVVSMVTGAASLASTPAEIDPLLDKVRIITARLKPGETPAPSDEDTLLDVYLQIEDYLTTRDPARAFTKQEIRSHLRDSLRKRLSAFESKGVA